MENRKSEDDLKTMMLRNIVDIGEISYKEELSRQESLIKQSGTILTIVSILLAFLGFILPELTKIVENTKLLYFCFSIGVLILFSIMICVIVVQWRMKYKKFQKPMDFFNKVSKDYEKFKEEWRFWEQKMMGFDDTTKSIEKNNNCRVKLIKASHIMIFVFIGWIIFSIIIITWY